MSNLDTVIVDSFRQASLPDKVKMLRAMPNRLLDVDGPIYRLLGTEGQLWVVYVEIVGVDELKGKLADSVKGMIAPSVGPNCSNSLLNCCLELGWWVDEIVAEILRRMREDRVQIDNYRQGLLAAKEKALPVLLYQLGSTSWSDINNMNFCVDAQTWSDQSVRDMFANQILESIKMSRYSYEVKMRVRMLANVDPELLVKYVIECMTTKQADPYVLDRLKSAFEPILRACELANEQLQVDFLLSSTMTGMDWEYFDPLPAFLLMAKHQPEKVASLLGEGDSQRLNELSRRLEDHLHTDDRDVWVINVVAKAVWQLLSRDLEVSNLVVFLAMTRSIYPISDFIGFVIKLQEMGISHTSLAANYRFGSLSPEDVCISMEQLAGLARIDAACAVLAKVREDEGRLNHSQAVHKALAALRQEINENVSLRENILRELFRHPENQVGETISYVLTKGQPYSAAWVSVMVISKGWASCQDLANQVLVQAMTSSDTEIRYLLKEYLGN